MEGDDDAEDDIDVDAIPCDTLAATLLLRSQFFNVSTRDVIPFALRSQLYTIVNDRTVVDRELDMLRYSFSASVPSDPMSVCFVFIISGRRGQY